MLLQPRRIASPLVATTHISQRLIKDPFENPAPLEAGRIEQRSDPGVDLGL